MGVSQQPYLGDNGAAADGALSRLSDRLNSIVRQSCGRFKPRKFAQYLNAREIPGIRFVPTWFAPAKDAKLGGQRVGGVQMIATDRSVLDAPELGLELGSRGLGVGSIHRSAGE